jgi:hypothetical protein
MFRNEPFHSTCFGGDRPWERRRNDDLKYRDDGGDRGRHCAEFGLADAGMATVDPGTSNGRFSHFWVQPYE